MVSWVHGFAGPSRFPCLEEDEGGDGNGRTREPMNPRNLGSSGPLGRQAPMARGTRSPRVHGFAGPSRLPRLEEDEGGGGNGRTHEPMNLRNLGSSGPLGRQAPMARVTKSPRVHGFAGLRLLAITLLPRTR